MSDPAHLKPYADFVKFRDRFYAVADSFNKLIDSLPATFIESDSKSGRGVVICAGGETYLVNAYCLVRLLRYLGCTLPVQIWYAGKREYIRAIADELICEGCTLIDAAELGFERVKMSGTRCIDGNVYNGAMTDGFALKSFALVSTSFDDVLLLDGDCFPHYDPAILFSETPFQRTKCLMWPDWNRCLPGFVAERFFGKDKVIENKVFTSKIVECESGQMLVSTKTHYAPLVYAWKLNQRRNISYQALYGDKDTYQLGFRRFEHDYTICPTMPDLLKHDKVVLGFQQFDFQGNELFSHRVRGGKLTFYGDNPCLGRYPHHDKLLEFLSDLERKV
jgi:alpha 1,2-mannosyltransferase